MKKNMILLAVVLMMVLIMGCMRGGGWYKPGMTPEQFSIDRDECLRRGTMSRQGNVNTIDLSQFIDCMGSKGYTWEKKVDDKTGKVKVK